MRSLRFYLDYLSSNAYLAWVELPALASRHALRIEPVPVLFAGLLDAHGQLGPAEVRPKARWMARNNLRKAALLGVPLHPPRFHPFNPLLALRASSLPMPEDARARLVGACFEGCWVRGLHMSEPAVLARVADEVGLDGAALVAAAVAPEAKRRLRDQTDQAIADGVFGVPTMIVDGELFWGYDDWAFLERFLAGDDPLDREAARAWDRPQRPSAMRARHRERPPLRLAHANLPARDPSALAQWWADALGLERRGDFVVGPGTLVAFEPGEPIGARGNTHLGFEVPSRDEVVAWGRRLGVEVESDGRSASLKAHDPEGNVFEIYWEPDGPAGPDLKR